MNNVLIDKKRYLLIYMILLKKHDKLIYHPIID